MPSFPITPTSADCHCSKSTVTLLIHLYAIAPAYPARWLIARPPGHLLLFANAQTLRAATISLLKRMRSRFADIGGKGKLTEKEHEP